MKFRLIPTVAEGVAGVVEELPPLGEGAGLLPKSFSNVIGSVLGATL
jgi:hypothetical protein